MLATLVDEPFDDKGWVFETKWDSFRLITEKHDAVRRWSRNGPMLSANNYETAFQSGHRCAISPSVFARSLTILQT
jgi:ATP-dependent DNA ligase